jgi:hypothetical protein
MKTGKNKTNRERRKEVVAVAAVIVAVEEEKMKEVERNTKVGRFKESEGERTKEL